MIISFSQVNFVDEFVQKQRFRHVRMQTEGSRSSLYSSQ